jgi:Spy/CpxP family protein refolding chaperone
MKATNFVLAVAVSAVFGGLVWAAEQTPSAIKPEPAKPGHHEHDSMMMGPWHLLRQLNLTEEQKDKVGVLRKEYGPKFRAAMDKILTPDQRKARDEAMKAAKEAKEEGKRPAGHLGARPNLTDEQRAKLRETVRPLEKEVLEKIRAILTPKQREQLKALMAEHREKRKVHEEEKKGT